MKNRTNIKLVILILGISQLAGCADTNGDSSDGSSESTINKEAVSLELGGNGKKGKRADERIAPPKEAATPPPPHPSDAGPVNIAIPARARLKQSPNFMKASHADRAQSLLKKHENFTPSQKLKSGGADQLVAYVDKLITSGAAEYQGNYTNQHGVVHAVYTKGHLVFALSADTTQLRTVFEADYDVWKNLQDHVNKPAPKNQ